MEKKANKASIFIECEYDKKEGITKMLETKLVGNSMILVSLLLAALKKICEDSEVNYREFLSQEIKNQVIRETKERLEKEQNGEK